MITIPHLYKLVSNKYSIWVINIRERISYDEYDKDENFWNNLGCQPRVGGYTMGVTRTYYIDAEGRPIIGLKKSSLIKRIKEGIFTEAKYEHRKNWRLFINNGREMIWIHA
jgi:hypothetical protein